MARRCPPEGLRVQFRPNPVSRMLYSALMPRSGTRGYVTAISLGGHGNRTCIPGPGGGLVYVRFPQGTTGVAPGDLRFGRKSARRSKYKLDGIARRRTKRRRR